MTLGERVQRAAAGEPVEPKGCGHDEYRVEVAPAGLIPVCLGCGEQGRLSPEWDAAGTVTHPAVWPGAVT